jgi:hypothetical protein
MLQVLDQFAGQMMKCPMCAGTFTVPGLQSTPPAPAPAMTPPGAAAAPVMPFPTNGAATPPAGYQHVYSLTLHPRFVLWLAPASQIVLLVLMFLPWVESGVGIAEPTEMIPTFTGWQTVFGDYSSNAGTLFGLLYILTLLTAIATVVTFFAPIESLPPAIRPLTPWLGSLVGVGALLCLLVLVAQVLSRFGPEQADLTKILGDVAKKSLLNNFTHTLWLRLAVFAEVVGVVGAGLGAWMTLRGKQFPPPRIDLTW